MTQANGHVTVVQVRRKTSVSKITFVKHNKLHFNLTLVLHFPAGFLATGPSGNRRGHQRRGH